MKFWASFSYIVLLVITFLLSLGCFAQNTQDSAKIKAIDTSKHIGFYEFPDKEPEPPGGWAAYSKYISSNIHYPRAAIDSNKQGTVIVSVVIQEDGSIGNTKVVKGIGGGCDEEALRIIQSMPRWKPAEMNEKPVKYILVIPVKFQLEDK